jgi:hypothetical protein
MKVIEVVDDPGGEQMSQGYGPQGWMLRFTVQLGGAETQGAQEGEILAAQASEFLEQRRDRSAVALAILGKRIERRKLTDHLVGKDDASPRNPVVLLVVDHMDQDSFGGPGLGVLLEVKPGVWEIPEERPQDTRRRFQKREGFVELKDVGRVTWLHLVPPSSGRSGRGRVQPRTGPVGPPDGPL